MPMKFMLYMRSNCSLCEAMEEELASFVSEYGITVNRLYIDNDDDLQKRYADKIPVLTLNDEVLCHYFLDAEVLRKAIVDKT